MARKNRRLMYSRSILLYIVLAFLICIKGFSQSKKNFLVVENPFELKILNKYEQNLSPSDSSYFSPFCPIEIVAGDTLLSDDYTPAFIGKIDNQYFYFIKPEKNLPFNNLFDSFSKYYKYAQSLMDTIQILQDNKIIFYNAKNKNLKERLLLNTKLVRIFNSGSHTYVKNLNNPGKYGWCDLRNSKTWSNYQLLKKEKIEDIAEIESIIKLKLTDTNNIIKKLFNHFNNLNHVNIQVPYWTYLNKENEFVCTMLNNDYNYNFTESTNILIHELHLALSHTTYNVLWQSNDILINKTK